jgi:hypothetical protein
VLVIVVSRKVPVDFNTKFCRNPATRRMRMD